MRIECEMSKLQSHVRAQRIHMHTFIYLPKLSNVLENVQKPKNEENTPHATSLYDYAGI